MPDLTPRLSGWDRYRMWEVIGHRVGRCPHCGYGMHSPQWLGRDQAFRATLDHIIPLCLGGTHDPDNVRLICALCNHSREAAGHCVGALACIRAVLAEERPTVKRVARLWGQWRRAAVDLQMVGFDA